MQGLVLGHTKNMKIHGFSSAMIHPWFHIQIQPITDCIVLPYLLKKSKYKLAHALKTHAVQWSTISLPPLYIYTYIKLWNWEIQNRQSKSPGWGPREEQILQISPMAVWRQKSFFLRGPQSSSS
ncbi:unnamed protein product [Rangifer tarandus platyrhynchus]|uniref:Uncharacterized protein n=1 Tax=Rangifer tarandus platyrhynchus TaxID=3082113 RepID=A0AC59Y608_RANTA